MGGRRPGGKWFPLPDLNGVTESELLTKCSALCKCGLPETWKAQATELEDEKQQKPNRSKPKKKTGNITENFIQQNNHGRSKLTSRLYIVNYKQSIRDREYVLLIQEMRAMKQSSVTRISKDERRKSTRRLIERFQRESRRMLSDRR